MPMWCGPIPLDRADTSSPVRVPKDLGRLRLALVSVQYTFPLRVRNPHASRNATLFELLVTCQGTGLANQTLDADLSATSRTSYRLPLSCQWIKSACRRIFRSSVPQGSSTGLPWQNGDDRHECWLIKCLFMALDPRESCKPPNRLVRTRT
jgi:hypothetical protein